MLEKNHILLEGSDPKKNIMVIEILQDVLSQAAGH